MSYIPNSNSVVGFQSQPSSLLVGASIIGLTPVNVVNTPSPSVIAYQAAGSILAVSGTFTASPQASINAIQLAGSVLAVNVPTPSYISYQLAGSILAVSGSFSAGNTSVSAFIESTNTSVFAILKNSSVAVLQGTNPWIINQPSPSIVATQIAGSVMNVNVSGSVATVSNGSVTAYQGGVWATSMVGGPIQVSSIPGTYQEKAAAGNASVIGHAMLFKNNVTTSTLATISTLDPLPIIGSVATLQGTNPWQVNLVTPSLLSIQSGGSVLAVRTDNASIIAVGGGVQITSVMNTLPSSLLVGASVFGNIGVYQIGTWATSVVGGPLQINSILSTYQEKASSGNASVIGLAMLFKNNATTSTLSTVSTLDPLPVQGSVATLQGTNPWQVNLVTPSLLSIQPGGSVLNANISGSVSAVMNTGNSSVQLISTSASIATLVNNILTGNASVQLISTSASIMVNNKAIFGANNTWTQNNSVLATGGLRNDTMSSITTADSTYSPFAVGPIGETIVANSPITKWVVGRGSVQSGTSIQLLAGPGTSIFTYISGIHLTNEASIATRVTITQGLGAVPASMLTWFVVPAGGGSNAVYVNPIRVLDNNGISASINAVASVYVTITGFTSKT